MAGEVAPARAQADRSVRRLRESGVGVGGNFKRKEGNRRGRRSLSLAAEPERPLLTWMRGRRRLAGRRVHLLEGVHALARVGVGVVHQVHRGDPVW